jgi:membrane peptidoglycan carboxypeptidase
VNVVYAQIARDVGPAHIVDVARRMGIRKGILPEVYSIVLGAGNVAPIEMAAAYSNFATNGLQAETYLIDRIVGPDGNVIYQHVPERRQVMDPAIMAAARRPLTKVPTGAGTAPKANIGRPQGGKTGTHQNYMDAWFVGFVPQYSTAVWVGYPDFQYPMRNVTINNQFYKKVFGGTIPAPIWAEFMTIALDGLPVEDFPEDPPGVGQYFVVPDTDVPLVLGMLEEDAVDAVFEAHLRPVVEQVASIEPIGTVVAQDPDPSAEGAPSPMTVKQGTKVTLYVSTGEPPSAPLPDLTGMTVDEAIAALDQFAEETGVEVSFVVEFVETTEPSLVGLIVATSPSAGTVVTYGDEITLFVGTEPPPGPPGPPGGGGGGGG